MRLNVSAAATGWKYVSKPLLIEWGREGADYVDRDGIASGPNPYAQSARITAAGDYSLDIAALDGDVVLQGVYDWTSPRIDGVPAEAFWLAPSNEGNGIAMPCRALRPGIVLNPQRGRVLTVSVTPRAAGVLTAHKLVTPERPQPLPYIGPAGVPDEWELPLTSEADLRAYLGAGNIGGTPWAYEPEFGIDPVYGFPYLEFTVPTTRELGIALFKNLTPRDEIHTRYLVMLRKSLWRGNRTGCKLPGPIDRGNDRGAEGLGWRAWHGMADRANPGIVRFSDYEYSMLVPNWPAAPDLDVYLHEERYHCIEHDAWTNTPGVANGIEQIHFDGHAIVDDRAKRWEDDARAWDCWHGNYWHGGEHLYPSEPYRVRLACIGGSRHKRVGMPIELLRGPAMPVPDATEVWTLSRSAYNAAAQHAGQPTIEEEVAAATAATAAAMTSLKAAVNAKLDALDQANATEDSAESTQDTLRAELRNLVA